jgi:hypothetical protein
MDKELREKLIAKARENGTKNGKVAELDFGAGAEWMYNELHQVKNNDDLGSVVKQLCLCEVNTDVYQSKGRIECAKCRKPVL